MAQKEIMGPDKELINLAFSLKPVLTDRDGQRHFLQPVDLYEKLWNRQQSAGLADGHITEIDRIEVKVPLSLLRGLVDAPTMAQVLPQIPAEYREKAVAFELRSQGSEEGDNGYMPATMTLFAGTLPPEIRDQPVRAWNKTYTEPFARAPAPKEAFNKGAATILQSDVHVLKPLQLKKDGGVAPTDIQPARKPPAAPRPHQ